MLQITSRRAQQTLTIHCKNLAFKDKQLMFHGFKSGSFVHPDSFPNGCGVSVYASPV